MVCFVVVVNEEEEEEEEEEEKKNNSERWVTKEQKPGLPRKLTPTEIKEIEERYLEFCNTSKSKPRK